MTLNELKMSLRVLEGALKKAAVGPWIYKRSNVLGASIWQDSKGPGWCIAKLMGDAPLDDIAAMAELNGELITLARNQLPAMIEAMQGVIDELQRLKGDHLPPYQG